MNPIIVYKNRYKNRIIIGSDGVIRKNQYLEAFDNAYNLRPEFDPAHASSDESRFSYHEHSDLKGDEALPLFFTDFSMHRNFIDLYENAQPTIGQFTPTMRRRFNPPPQIAASNLDRFLTWVRCNGFLSKATIFCIILLFILIILLIKKLCQPQDAPTF
jgi:hypothetical protein